MHPTATHPSSWPGLRVGGASLAWMSLALAAALLAAVYHRSWAYMLSVWMTDDNYGHGFLVPFISLALVWRKRHELAAVPRTGQWWGLPIMGAAALLYVCGELSSLYFVLLASCWLFLTGLLAAAMGLHWIRLSAFPLGYLLTMIPLPQFLHQGMAGQLQLWSSSLGVGCLQLVGVTAFQEGNVIDLGPIQLQVVEACSGLRYLIPLFSLSLLAAYLFARRWWAACVIVLSTIPIAILLNGLRIGMVGLLVEWLGVEAAEGFAHFAEGWMVFLLSIGLLAAEVWVLGRWTASKSSSPPRLVPDHVNGRGSGPWMAAIGLLAGFSLVVPHIEARPEAPPARHTFTDFPLVLQEWAGTPFPLEKSYLESLRLDDYVLTEYRKHSQPPVHLYGAYYSSQKAGQSAHSPMTCIPGGGWEIKDLTVRFLETPGQGDAFPVNRTLIQRGQDRQLVYYWFKQRHRHVTSEVGVKAYLFWDALTLNRTDGALIRLSTPVGTVESEREVDARLSDFARTVRPMLTRFVPD
jgi:exosortase D (VPLPA-CTERM-specific)